MLGENAAGSRFVPMPDLTTDISKMGHEVAKVSAGWRSYAKAYHAGNKILIGGDNDIALKTLRPDLSNQRMDFMRAFKI